MCGSKPNGCCEKYEFLPHGHFATLIPIKLRATKHKRNTQPGAAKSNNPVKRDKKDSDHLTAVGLS